MSSATATNSTEQYGELIRRILASKQFRSSPRLYELFNYVASASLRDAPQDATEQQIGINVFGRKPGYNCSEDSIVRSEIRQLRMKLNAYFSDEGAQERVRVEIPKGRYLLEFQPRAKESDRSSNGSDGAIDSAVELAETVKEPVITPSRSRLSRVGWPITLSLLVLGSICLLGFLLNRRHTADPPRSADILWQPFLSENIRPIVVFSNAALTMNDLGSERTRGHLTAKKPSPHSVDVLTGVGEVAAVHALDELFVSHSRDFLLRRNYLLSWEEARDDNLIVLGSTDENTSIRDLPTTQEFSFRYLDHGEMTGEFAIVNNHPRPGEKPFYTGEDQEPLIEDFAIVALLPGPTPRHWMLVLGGLETYGTQGAAEYAVSEEGASRLLKLLGSPGKPQAFEAVLHFDVNGGVPLNPQVVAFHRR